MKFSTVRLLFIYLCCIVSNIEIEYKQSVLPPLIKHRTTVRKRGGAMENVLIDLIYMLFLGLIGMTVIAIALIIALVIIISK